MRDPGLNEAIRAVGGVSELARQLGLSQPSISNWTKVPAERVASVESLTGVNRVVLRPDLFGERKMSGDIDEVDSARAQEYALLSALLARAPDAALLKRLATLRGDASRSALPMSRWPRPPRASPSNKWNANSSICSSASAAAN
jgi:DNA-binding transcriptional regulator YdaS (Cro superfamily)